MTTRRRGPAAPPPGGPRTGPGAGSAHGTRPRGTGRTAGPRMPPPRQAKPAAGPAPAAARSAGTPHGADGRRGERPPGGGRRPPRRPPPAGRPPKRLVRRDPLKRINVGLVLVAFVLSLFAGRLVQLQGIDSKVYQSKSRAQALDTITLPAIRGPITDAQGNPLAMTVDARLIFADPGMVRPEQKAQIAAAFASTFGMNQADVMADLNRRHTHYVPIVHNVPPEQARMITAMDFTGIGVDPEYRRVYPNNSVGANVIGFVHADGKGAAGLEFGMDGLLAGRSGWQRVELGANGQRIPMGTDQQKKPIPGRGVRLTLERDIQWKAQDAIAKQVQATGSESGTVIVMDPRNGQVLAMATAPTFDPESYWKANGADLGDRAVQDGFEPGSTNKVITAAAVLEAGGVTPNTPFTVPYSVRRWGVPFHDAEAHGTERLTFAGVLAKSSNVGTIEASEHISAQTLYDYLRAFGYGQQTGIGLPGEATGDLKPLNRWDGTDRYSIAFGQTVSVTALQTASVYATIANGGVRVTPNLVLGTTDGSGGTVTSSAAPPSRRVISAQTAQEISDMLEGVTSKDGTAPEAKIPGYRVAGKTGTAERINPKCGCYSGGGYTATFVGFAPADNPRLLVEVVLQKPQRGEYGGVVAAPVFRDVMSFALQSRKVPPTGTRSPSISLYASQ